ncbi:MAG: hypothetical protein LBR62_00220, partial [Puniceicoccales bacterium]|nr:hypothetical protein [Puniceicoccales bacterium]
MSSDSISGIDGSLPTEGIDIPSPPPPKFNDVRYPYGIPDWIMGQIDKEKEGITYQLIYDALIKIIGEEKITQEEVPVLDGEGNPTEDKEIVEHIDEYDWGTLGAQISELKSEFEEIQKDYTFGEKNPEGELDGDFCAQNWCGFEAYGYYLRSATRDIQVATQFLAEAKELLSQMNQLMENSQNLPSSQMAIQFQSLLTRLGSIKKQAETSIKDLTKVPVIGDDNLLRWEYESPWLISYSDLNSLREESFGNLNLLDKIKYISIYYKLASPPKTFP